MTEPPATVGRYHVERLIAHGGMGSIYVARDPAIDRLVVIKLLKEGFDDPAARERFAREARAAGRLHHPNIVTIFDVGEHENRPFIAMENVSGETLAELIRRRAIGRTWEKLGILEELCAGLHYAHRAAIVHRDVKPANVMRDESGLVKILDFGIARGSGMGITRAGDVVGTLNYMAPEQLAGEDVDLRADIYSVGALAYELITNQMAFPGTIQTGVLFRILNSGPVPIESLVPGIDPYITAMIERAMAREPDARYPDLETMRQDLAVVRTRLLETAADLEEATDPNAETRFESARITSGSLPRPSSRASSTLRASTRAIAARPSTQVIPPPRRAKLMLFLGVACAALAIALVSTLVLNWSSRTGTPAQTDTTPAQQAQPPAPSPAAPPPATAIQPKGVNRAPLEEQARAAHETPRQPIVLGQRKAPEGTGRNTSVAPPPTPPARPMVDPVEPTAAKPGSQPLATSPSPEPLQTVPFPAPSAPPTAPKPEPPAVPREPVPDPRTADLSAIRETLRRYTQAYQDLDRAAVGRMMPSLTADQLRDLDRDFANYRRYTVEIMDERIAVDGPTATVTCRVVRSFETKNGVAGSNTVQSTFHLRRSGSTWIIERLESR